MDENKVRSIVSDMLMSFDNMVVPQHRHNGVDCLQIPSSNLLPYPIQSGTGINTILTGNTNTPDGTIQFYNIQDSILRDWGLNISIGGLLETGKTQYRIWNPMTLVPSAIGANLATAQVFADSTPTILIADHPIYDLYPKTLTTGPGTISVSAAGTAITGVGTAFAVHFFVGSTISSNGETHTVTGITDNTHMSTDSWTAAVVAKPYTFLLGEYQPDGTFTCTTAGQYLVNGGVVFANAGGASGVAIITIILEHNATPIQFMRKVEYFSATELLFTLDISGIIQSQANDLLYIQIEQVSGGSLSTLTDENTWLNVQKQK